MRSRPFPGPPITRNQVELMLIDNVALAGMPGFYELEIRPRSVEQIMPTMLPWMGDRKLRDLMRKKEDHHSEDNRPDKSRQEDCPPCRCPEDNLSAPRPFRRIRLFRRRRRLCWTFTNHTEQRTRMISFRLRWTELATLSSRPRSVRFNAIRRDRRKTSRKRSGCQLQDLLFNRPTRDAVPVE